MCLVQKTFILSFDGNQWIYATCNGALTRGNMPTQAVANGLNLSTIPPELSCLNSMLDLLSKHHDNVYDRVVCS